MAIRVRTVPTEAHPFAPPGSVVIGVMCPDMPKPFLFAFPPPDATEAVASALSALGAEPAKPLDMMAMARHSVIAATRNGMFAGCACDERFWMKYGDTHEICQSEPIVDHSHCNVYVHLISKH
jgi:hypothetical protein